MDNNLIVQCKIVLQYDCQYLLQINYISLILHTNT